jgi:hypothetical protein
MLSNDNEAHNNADPSWGLTNSYKYRHPSCRTNVGNPKNRCGFLAVPPNHNLANITSNITLFVGGLVRTTLASRTVTYLASYPACDTIVNSP